MELTTGQRIKLQRARNLFGMLGQHGSDADRGSGHAGTSILKSELIEDKPTRTAGPATARGPEAARQPIAQTP
ncbi:hypothetical protein AB0J63_40290 [Streptosporangium canum]|uniref:hypothetical protein n=1 Tax=Streptosporangium canum TaxID=324952 RepID=UPI003429A183